MVHVFQIKWTAQQVAKSRVKRDVQMMFNDPMWPHQWYLVCIASHCHLVSSDSEVTITWRYIYIPLLTAKHRLGRSLFLLHNRFLALVLPNFNRSG